MNVSVKFPAVVIFQLFVTAKSREPSLSVVIVPRFAAVKVWSDANAAIPAPLKVVEPVPPFASGKAPVTFDVRSIDPASIALVIVDQAGSVPFVVSTVLALPIASREVALDELRTITSPRVVIGSLRFPASPVLVNEKYRSSLAANDTPALLT